uniref:carbonic anhydrase n=1 Tax=Gryllodes sigillatus TaxID=13551 RepID=A0A0P0AJM8_9ORTH|nr:spermatophylax protein 10 [Gryllodes sigillatus]
MGNSRYSLFIGAMLLAVCSAEVGVWNGTENAEDWVKSFPECGGKEQSPIEILSGAAKIWTPTEQKKNKFEMKFDNYDKSGTVKPYLTGYLPNITFEFPSTSEAPRITLTQRGETVEYFLTNIHFHWPGEHTFDGQSFDFETHVVHRNLEKNRVIALAYLINICRDSSEEEIVMYDQISAAQKNEKSGSSYSYSGGPTLFVPRNYECGYYKYDGSFTTPPCTEGVTWFVYRKPLCVAQDVIDAFKKMKNKDGQLVQSNNRPIQESNREVVYLSCNEDAYNDEDDEK